MNTNEIFDKVWAEFIARLQLLRDKTPKATYEEIGKMCGVSKVTARRWIEDEAGGEKTSFPDMLRYMQVVGLDISGMIPTEISEEQKKEAIPAPLVSEIISLRGQLRDMQEQIKKLERERMEFRDQAVSKSGEVAALERQIEILRKNPMQEDDNKKTA